MQSPAQLITFPTATNPARMCSGESRAAEQLEESMAAELLEEKLLFAINGVRFELSKVDPSTTLLEFLRTQTRYRGAKLGCGEGGCGACVVLLSTYDSASEVLKEFTVSSCLTLLCSIHLCSVTTTEGLGNSKDAFHAIHQRFSGFHASQCGFCTPGMCMSLFSALINADKSPRPEPRDGFSKLTVSEAEKAIVGNLCRCTGYRPIVDACKSFATNVDMEDLGLNSFWKKYENDVSADRLPVYRRNGICTFPDFLKFEIISSLDRSLRSVKKDASNIRTNVPDVSNDSMQTTLLAGCWYHPASLDDLYKLLNCKKLDNASHMKMVAGNTGSGVYKELDPCDQYIDLRGIQELLVIKRDNKGIELGAAVTISRAIEALKEENDGEFSSNERFIFTKIAQHMTKVASESVRNIASLGGNLIMAQRKQFPSDIATILLAVGATVSLQMETERLILSLEEFLESPSCSHRTLLLSILIPSWSSVSKTSSSTDGLIDSKTRVKSNLLFETYRAAPRPLGNSLAYLNSAFFAQISLNKISGDLIVDNIRLAFGAYGVQHATRARKVEDFLMGKPVTTLVFLEAFRILREVIVPKEDAEHRAYRTSLAISFLFNFLQLLVGSLKETAKNVDINNTNTVITEPSCTLHECLNGSLEKASKNADLDPLDNHDPLLSSKQVVVCSMDYHPVGEPTKKAGAEIQASGEAVYVDDIPSPQDCLYGAFIYSTRPLANIKGIKLKSTPASRKVIAVVSANEVPIGGKNIGSSSIFGSEPLFANSLTEYAGQPLGLVIAESQKFANICAKQAIVDYSTENLEPPILSVEEAIRKSSFFEVLPFIYPKQVGDFSKGMAEADHKIHSAQIELGSQYYFYMETQTALAIPDEDNCIVVYSSTQCPENTQGVIARCLGIPDHNVRVITRRVGGGFGGKALRSAPVATACALAAHKLQRPVRMYLDRQTDMIMAGGRHPMKIKYSVGFKSDGKITALHIDLLINAGISADVSPMIPHNVIAALKKYNWGALSFDVKVCKTNLPTKSAMRGPGEVQGSFIAEAVIEHVASTLSVNANSVRHKNLHTFESLMLFYEGSAGEASEYTLPSIFDNLALSSSYHQRVETIRNFNHHHKWKKRGVSCTPIVHQVTLRATPGKVGILGDGSIVVEVGGIELGQGLWTKVKQMAAYALGQIWDDVRENLLERVRVIQADTLSLIQGGWTTGSTTSESSCEAIRLACNILVDRLRPIKHMLHEQVGSVTWDALIGQASLQSVDLSASTYWIPDYSSANYLNYGAAVSEVEIDLLTGATKILCTDITYDCGQSLNPAVDLGQVEGAFVQGIGFFMSEEYLSNSDGLVISEGTWTYKIPTVDTIPKQFNVELLSSGNHKNRVLSSKASGEPPLLLAVSVHCATREAIRAARAELAASDGAPLFFQLPVPATMPVVKELCGLDNVERYLKSCVFTE